MEISALLLISLIFVIVDYAIIKRNQIYYDNGKTFKVNKITLQSWKEAILLIAIIVSIYSVVVMYYWFYKMSFVFILKRLCLFSILWPIAITDYQEYRIPNKLILSGVALRLVVLVLELILAFDNMLSSLIDAGIAIFGTVIVCIACMLISRGSLGMGDLKLMILIASFIGVQGIFYSMFLSLFVSFVVSVVLLIIKIKKRTDAIPFAPFILVGTFASMILCGI